MSQNYSMRKRMSVITELYQILRKNREQIKNLIAENEALENRIEALALEDYIGESDTDDYEEESEEESEEEKPPIIKPQPISKELADFLGKPEGTLLTRTEATRDINNYIRTHGLQDKKNGRKINPDDKLKALLKLDDTIELTYFNFQNYLGHHFIKI